MMGSSAQRGRADNKRAGKKGTLPKDQLFVLLINAFRQEPAWRDLSFGARSLYVELKALYNGYNNNGRLMCSARYAAQTLGCSKNSVTGYFKELQANGFIVETQGGYLGVDGRGQGRLWRLTELGFMGDMPTKEYKNWVPPKNKLPYQDLGQRVPKAGTASAKGVPKAGTGRPKGWDGNGAKTADECPKNRDDLIYQGEGETDRASVNGGFVGEPRRFTTVIGGRA
jgi:hypothetical protein